MEDEGYIKFHCTWHKKKLSDTPIINELNCWRDKLYKHHLIGAYPDGTGYGNMSIRLEANTFIITGTATGRLSKLTKKHFVKVNCYDILQNSLTCEGPIKASSESLTHAMIYESLPSIRAVMHVHHNQLWEKLIDNMPTTSPTVAYGTPEMAMEVKRIVKSTDLQEKKVLVMAGHQDGLIIIGEYLKEAGKIALSLINNNVYPRF